MVRIICCFLLAWSTLSAASPIQDIYKSTTVDKGANISKRIAAFSEKFIGKPYMLDALGEGKNGKFSQNPLYRTDAFDCVTYVSTVLALAVSDDFKQFAKTVPLIRYRNGDIAFVKRNHFVSVDWNYNNQHNGYVRDFTYKITDANKKPIAEIANTIVNKPAWFKKLKADRLHLAKQDPKKLQQLHQLAKQTQQEKSIMLYIPLTKLFDAKGNAREEIFAQIPNASIIEIVRPNWQLQKLIGTNMQISHLGFAIRTAKGLMYRNASLIKKQVIDTPLAEYLKNYRNSPTIKGINIQEVTG